MGTDLAIHKTGVLAAAGIPQPLTQSLSPQEIDSHRAQIGMLCEMLSRKHDRFGWERMEQGFKRLILADFMNALQDYPIEEIRTAARQCEAANPDKMPNEQHIRRRIIASRQRKCDIISPRVQPEPGPAHLGVPDRETAAAIMERAGFTAKRFDAAKHHRMATSWAQMEAMPERRDTPREAYMTQAEIEAEDRRAAE